MAVYDVDLPNGKTIQVQGPDDASDDELIAIAKTHPSLAKQSAKPPTETSATGMKAGQLPEMSTPDQLIKDAKASTPGLKASIPGAFEATQGTNALPTAGGLYDLVSQGDMKGAWNALPESVRDVTQYGAPPAIAAYGLKKAYDAYKESSVGEGSQGIKSRTIGADNTTPPPPPPGGGTPSAAPAEPALSPKEAKIASDIENKYGFNWKDVKNNFNVSNVPITDATQAEILASAFKNQQASTQAPAAAPTPEAEVIKPAAEPAKAPAPPPAEAPKAAVPPEKLTKQQKGMKNHLVSMYGGGSEGEAAYAKVKEILKETPEFPKGQGGSLSPEQTKIIKDWRKVNIEGPKVNLTHDMKKALKGGGGLAVLSAIPGFAEAASNKDFGKMTDIATDFLVLPFAQSREVGEGEQFELAKARYEGMVGAGRGIAPPSLRQQVGRR